MSLIPQDPLIERLGMGEPVKGKTYIADGWVYRDLPRMAPWAFDAFIDLIGPDNLVWLSLADYGASKRGQCLISPAGQQRMLDFNASKRTVQ